MAEINITPFGFSDNDIADLSAILSHELRAYQADVPAFAGDYVVWLNTIAGLGYTAVLSEGCADAECLYREYLDRFIAARKDSLQALSIADIETVSQSIANMASEAMTSFSVIQFPKFYDSFAEALQQTVCHAELHGDFVIGEKAARLIRMVNCQGHRGLK